MHEKTCHDICIFGQSRPFLLLSLGTQIVTSCKDKKFRIFDARSGVLLLWGHGHDGSRSQRVIFVMDDKYLLSCGFSPTNERQVGMYLIPLNFVHLTQFAPFNFGQPQMIELIILDLFNFPPISCQMGPKYK